MPAARTTATLLPDTADRWVMPVASIASVSDARRPAGVADHQSGQEPPGVGRERGDRAAQPGTDVLGRRRHPPGVVQPGGWPPAG